MILFLKQKTAYEMRISDWSSDVCSSVLISHASVDDWIGWEAVIPPFVTPDLIRGPAALGWARCRGKSGTPDQVRGDGKLMSAHGLSCRWLRTPGTQPAAREDRKSTRLNYSH